MKKRIILLLLFFLSFLQLLDADFFKFIHVKGEKYRMLIEVTEKVFINGEFYSHAEILNKIAVEILEVKNKAGYISALYQTSERSYDDQGRIIIRLLEGFSRVLYYKSSLF